MYDGIFVLIVILIRRILRRAPSATFRSIPGHPFTDVDADLAADALVNRICTLGITTFMRRTCHAAYARCNRPDRSSRSLAACAIVGDDDCNLFGFFFLRVILPELGMISVDLLFWIVCHVSIHSFEGTPSKAA